MSELEKLFSLEKLDELSKNVIEKMEEVQPIEMPENIQEIETPTIEGLKRNPNISFKGGNCMCSCDLTCTRA